MPANCSRTVTSLGYALMVVDGDGSQAGVVDNVIRLGTTDASGCWWTGYLSNQLQNGSQTLLLVQNSTATVGEKLDPNHHCVLDLVPWSSVADSVAVTDGDVGDQTYSPVVLRPRAGQPCYCAPRVEGGFELEAIRRGLAVRAGAQFAA